MIDLERADEGQERERERDDDLREEVKRS